ncbi:hypothetical protein DFH09DRAFT_1067153 [Mycena vulgaris]|nr:hypothetical protein DFH09DRAFT_1067153 [Mycena vulgaris]
MDYLDMYADDSAGEGEGEKTIEEYGQEDEDSSEAQIRAADRADFALDEILGEHEANLRSPRTYRAPRLRRRRTDTELTLRQPHPSLPEEEENPHRLKRRRLENQHSAVTQFLDLEATEDRDESDPDEEDSMDDAFIDDDGLSHHSEGEESTDLRNPALEFMDEAEELAAIAKDVEMRSRARQNPRISAWGDKNTSHALNSGQNVPEALQSLEQHLAELQRHPQAPQLAPPRIRHGPRGALTLVDAAPVLPGMWGRLRRSLKQGPKKGSLAFADSDTTFLVVADVKMEGDDDDTKSGNTETARKDAKSMGKRLREIIRIRLTKNRPLSKALLPENAPSAEEIAIFDEQDHPLLRHRPALSGPGLALTEGSRVVVKPLDGELLVFGDSGYITEIHGATATVRRSYCGKRIIQLQQEFFTQLTGNASDDDIQINIESLRRHILDIPCNLQLGDRVEVVSPTSEWMGKQARVMQIELHPGSAFVDLVEAESTSTFQVDMADLKRVFAIGDLVKAFGQYTPPTLDYPYEDRHHEVGSTMELQTSSVLAAHLEFALEESGPGAEGGDAADPVLHGERDIIRKQMHTGNCPWMWHEVMIVGKHNRKGFWGTVVGNHEKLGADQSRQRWVTIREEGSNYRYDIGIEHVVHRHSLKPLVQNSQDQVEEKEAMARLKRIMKVQWAEKELQQRRSATNVPPGVDVEDNVGDGSQTPMQHEFDPEWMAETPGSSQLTSAPARSPTILPLPAPPAIGEHGGDWLCLPKLAHKRVDVIVGAKTQGRVTALQARSQGQTGFIEINGALAEKDLMTPIAVRLGQDRKVVKMEPRYLKPIRTTLELGFPLSIAEVIGRVVIIGPDVNGDKGRMGEYAQTCERTSSLPANSALVQFAREDPLQPLVTAVYHVQSLCSSYNADGVSTKATIFF